MCGVIEFLGDSSLAYIDARKLNEERLQVNRDDSEFDQYRYDKVVIVDKLRYVRPRPVGFDHWQNVSGWFPIADSRAPKGHQAPKDPSVGDSRRSFDHPGGRPAVRMVAPAIHVRARFAPATGQQERKLAVISMRNIMAVGAIVLLFVVAIVAPAPAAEPCRPLLGKSLVSIAD